MTGPGDRNGDAATPPGRPTSRRSLRAVLSGDLAGFSGQVSVNETGTLLAMREVRQIAMAQLDKHNGWLFGMPGDGLFALFESAVDAVQCALELQSVFAQTPILDEMRMRIGVHMGEVLFDNDLPFGETLTIAKSGLPNISSQASVEGVGRGSPLAIEIASRARPPSACCQPEIASTPSTASA